MRDRPDLRDWVGDNATDPSKDEVRSFVVWGTGPVVPAEMVFEGAGNDIAEGIARAHDTSWAEHDPEDRWCIVMHADEDDVDELVADIDRVSGFAPYLAEGLTEEMPPDGYMRGTLRSDVAPRRKVSQPRPS